MQIEPAPMFYKLHVWRKEMGASYADQLLTPQHIILQDLEIMSLENEFKPNPGA